MTTRNAASMGDYGSEWQFNGYAGCGNVTNLIGSLKGHVALVVGSGQNVFTDLKTMGPEHVVFAVNDIGMFLPRVDHWVSLHGQNLSAWKRVRWLHPHPNEATKYHSGDAWQDVDYVWDKLTPTFVLSGYFAMQIAYIMDADQIILCGCPGDATPRFFDFQTRREPGSQHFFYNETGVVHQLEHEMKRLPDFKVRVRSMSGWTKEFFGGI